jgi:CRISPR-associated protein Cmr4
VGAIDQPIVRERHTGFPVIPASSLKGTFADAWNDVLETGEKGGKKRGYSDAAWLFGSDDATPAFAGALLLSEARLLAFPIRSARGSFAWITCPLMLQRAARDGVLAKELVEKLPEPEDDNAIFDAGARSKLAIAAKIVLEEYTFGAQGWTGLVNLGEALAALMDDAVWSEVKDRLVILSNGMMSYFAQNACEIAQHVRISDETGTAEKGALFNQENVPGETLFYSLVHFLPGRSEKFKDKTAGDAAVEFAKKLNGHAFQFGGDASTGLGYCTVKISEKGAE